METKCVDARLLGYSYLIETIGCCSSDSCSSLGRLPAWEWLHKKAAITADDPATGTRAGDAFGAALFARLLSEEYEKLLAARGRDVHDDSKATTLPIARAIVAEYVSSSVKYPWYIDLLNLNLNSYDLATAKSRIRSYVELFERDGTRITENLDFGGMK